MSLEVPFESNHKTEAKWREKDTDFLRFVDDGFLPFKD